MIDYLTISGGVVADAEMKTTPSGATVATFRIGQSDSRKNDQGDWETTQSLYLPVVIWNENPQWKQNPIPWAEMAADLRRGDRVAVRGKLVTRSWEANDGAKRSVTELNAEAFFVMPKASNQAQGEGSATGGWGAAGKAQHQSSWGAPRQ